MRVSSTGQSDGDLAVIAANLMGAAAPEAIFGELAGSDIERREKIHRRYWQFALLVHPDRHGNDPLAAKAFVALQRLYDLAQERIASGQYGQPDVPGAFTLSTRRRTYTVGDLLAEGDFASLYACTVHDARGAFHGTLKIARDPQDNDLLANEARVLRHLTSPVDARPIPAYIPRLGESFQFPDADGQPRIANAFPFVETERGPLPASEFFTLEEIRAAYPDGVEAGHMAWIWRRLLLALGYAHDRETIHGAVLPPHILIHPAEHGLLLVDWCASLLQPHLTGQHIPAISSAYERWYPLSVHARKTPTPAVDLEMGLRSMVYLLGGDPLSGALPPGVPAPIGAYLRGALAANPAAADAGRLYRDFTATIDALWGKRRFLPFAMPVRR